MPNKPKDVRHSQQHWLITVMEDMCYFLICFKCYIDGCMHLKAIKSLWITEHSLKTLPRRLSSAKINDEEDVFKNGKNVTEN